MNELILTVGLPRSGKSTWARQQNLPMVNPDSIRLALYGQAFIIDAEDMVWTIAKYMVKSLFLAGHETVILDATNTTEKRRDFWVSEKWLCKYKLFDTNEEECIKRARESNQLALIPVIQNMNNKFEILTVEEHIFKI
jgi:predicted kinase